jgi:hypothetical protein
MGFHCSFKDFKTLKAGEKSKMIFGNSGVENIIPYLLEVDLIGTWAPYLNYVKKIQMINSSRFLVEEKYDLPFPLSTRQGDMYFQFFNNIEVNGKAVFVVKSYDCPN